MRRALAFLPWPWLSRSVRLGERLRVALALGLRPAPTYLAEIVRGFQATEADGVWHLRRAIEKLESPRARAAVFAHCLQEEAHADAFVTTYACIAENAFRPVHFERRDLQPARSPVWKSFVVVHIGEEDAAQRFRVLADALPPGALRSCLTTVVADEEGHVGLTDEMLVALGAAPAAIRFETRKVRLQRAWEAWLRLGRSAVDRLATIALTLAYFLAGPLLASHARRKLASRSVNDTTGIKRL